MDKKTLGFIGGGRITKIMLTGLKNVGYEFDGVTVFDPNEDNLKKIEEISPEIKATGMSLEQVANSEVVIVAVHPPLVMEVLEKMKPFMKNNTVVVSLTPKITIEKIQSVLPEVVTIMRVNPSAPDIINKGINPVAFSKTCKENDRTFLMELFGMLGNTSVVDESKIEAYAIISAMGSTYFWFQMQHLQELGVQFGLDQEEAKLVIQDMMRGTIETLFFSNIPKQEVMDLVPVKPIGEYEETIKEFYSEKLTEIYNKIKP